jgi:DNA-binding MarR family transcriptional regulator
MTNPKLNDLQLVLLSTAAQRDDGCVFPVAESIAKDENRVRKAVESLLKRSLVEEGPTTDRLAWREHDGRRIAVFITDAGRSLIDHAADGAEPHGGGESTAKNAKTSVEQVRKGSKMELVLGLLRRPVGATLDELVTATGWLPHTTRAALTSLRKTGHVVEKTKRDDATCYRVVEVA